MLLKVKLVLDKLLVIPSTRVPYKKLSRRIDAEKKGIMDKSRYTHTRIINFLIYLNYVQAQFVIFFFSSKE